MHLPEGAAPGDSFSFQATRGNRFGDTSCLLHWLDQTTQFLIAAWTLADLARSKPELLVENALLRQQLIVLKRQVKRPTYTPTDRILFVLFARVVRTWKQTLLLVQPETLLRWHREGFRLVCRRRSKTLSHKPRVAAETITLIREMAAKNRL